MKISDIINSIEAIAPPVYQETYDNSGLITGNMQNQVEAALLTLDTTEAVIDEAIEKNCGLIISHHPIIFNGLKTITGKNYVERTVIKAIKNDIAIYAAHTNFDASRLGVNRQICKKLGLEKTNILSPLENTLYKLVTFVPNKDTDKVREAIFRVGAGQIGEYDSCSYNIDGTGTFRGSGTTNPYKGEKGKLHFEPETRIETILPKHLKSKVIDAMLRAHPYEEVAYDIYPLQNKYEQFGMGMYGELAQPLEGKTFLSLVKKQLNAGVLRHTSLLNRQITRVAVCGGTGGALLKNAILVKADAFITSDVKYHQFFDAENKIIIVDVGHFETEQFTKEAFYTLLNEKFPTFALYKSEQDTNPVNYF